MILLLFSLCRSRPRRGPSAPRSGSEAPPFPFGTRSTPKGFHFSLIPFGVLRVPKGKGGASQGEVVFYTLKKQQCTLSFSYFKNILCTPASKVPLPVLSLRDPCEAPKGLPLLPALWEGGREKWKPSLIPFDSYYVLLLHLGG